MQKRHFSVPIVYKGLSNFIVEATSAEEAEELARERFLEGETPELLGNEWEDIENVGDIQACEPTDSGAGWLKELRAKVLALVDEDDVGAYSGCAHEREDGEHKVCSIEDIEAGSRKDDVAPPGDPDSICMDCDLASRDCACVVGAS